MTQTPPDQDGGAAQGEDVSQSTDTAKLLEAIAACQEAVKSCQTTLTARIEEVKIDVSLIRQDFQKIRERVTDAETQLGMVEDSIPPFRFLLTPCSYRLLS